jgi:hypothetical protein
MSIMRPEKYTTRSMVTSFVAQPEFLDACDELAQELQLTSRAQLVLAALTVLAEKHGKTLPPRLNPNRY